LKLKLSMQGQLWEERWSFTRDWDDWGTAKYRLWRI